MRVLSGIFSMALMLTPALSCKADEGFDNIRYDVKSYQWWPIIVFVNINNKSSGGYHENGHALLRNSGYNEWSSTVPVRNLQPINNNIPTLVSFDVTWYEIVTKRSYKATVEIDSRKLKPEPIRQKEGLLILRIARGGDIQAVTYSGHYPQQGLEQIALGTICGKQIALPADKLTELERMLNDPQIMEGSAHHAKPEEIPSRCR